MHARAGAGIRVFILKGWGKAQKEIVNLYSSRFILFLFLRRMWLERQKHINRKERLLEPWLLPGTHSIMTKGVLFKPSDAKLFCHTPRAVIDRKWRLAGAQRQELGERERGKETRESNDPITGTF